MLIALTRPVSPSLAHCELTHLSREPIDIPRAIAQHAQYEATLRSLGIPVVPVPAAPEFPDSVFIEDTALALDEVAIITRPGAPSRRGETPAVAQVLSTYRELLHLTPPATLDGGDVLTVGRTLYVGLSSRTNQAAIDQLQTLLNPYAYKVIPIPLANCLHLKSAITLLADNTLLLNPQWLPSSTARFFPNHTLLPIHPTEPYAANALLIPSATPAANPTHLYPTHFPRTRDLLLQKNIPLTLVDNSELAKAEGAVTCCSILLNSPH